MFRIGDAEVINLDTDDDDDDDDDDGKATQPSMTSCSSVVWDLSRATLQVEQMIERRYLTAPLGNRLRLVHTFNFSCLSLFFTYIIWMADNFIELLHSYGSCLE